MSTQDSSNIQIAIFAIKASQAKKLLGINLDNNLKSDTHVEFLLESKQKTQCSRKNSKLYGTA